MNFEAINGVCISDVVHFLATTHKIHITCYESTTSLSPSNMTTFFYESSTPVDIKQVQTCVSTYVVATSVVFCGQQLDTL